MNSINSLGIRMVVITGIGIAVLWGGFKLITLGFSHTLIQAPSPTPQQSLEVSLQATPTPEQSLSPEALAQLANLAKNDSSKIGPETKKYVSSLPKDAPQSQVLDQNTLNQYVTSNQGQLLQELPAGTIKTTTASGKAAIKTYLDSISPAQNKALQNVTGSTILAAFQKQESGEDAAALSAVLTSMQSNFTVLKAIPTPKEALTLQTTLLQATQALITNIQRVQTFKEDQINGLIGLKNISSLDAVFTTISTQISTLEKKYNLQ